MTAPGLIWMPGSIRLTPGWLHARLSAIYGASLVGLWIGEDIVVSGSDVTSWPGRVGQPWLASGPGILVAAISGRRAARQPDAGTYRRLSQSLSGVRSLVCLATYEGQFPLPSLATLASSGIYSGTYIRTASGSNQLSVENQGATYYIDGFNTRVISSSSRIFENVGNTTGSSTASLLSEVVASRNWIGKLAAVVAITSVQSAEQRAASAVALRAYYGF